ncbi:MAG: hypothetical protein HY889_07030 [Deltaproteobacteria bacterium]|nr:hypothetical protein [Deltaproteobacteria bacterium]
MNFTGDLKKALWYHLAAGAALSAAVFTLVLTDKYSVGVRNTAAKIETVRNNTVRMEEATRTMIERREFASGVLTAAYEKRSHRETILLALERAKGYLNGAEMRPEDFSVEKGELVLPVAVEFKASKYRTGVSYVEYLEALRFPYFRLTGVTAKKPDGADGIVWRVEGSFRMPERRIENAPEARTVN